MYRKDAAKAEVLRPGDIAAPVITGLRLTDKEFNDNPVVAFTLTVPDALQTQVTSVSAAGGAIYVEVCARVTGDTEWIMLQNSDRDVKPGEMESALLHLVTEERPNIPADTVIELRCRYFCSQPGQEDFFSDWSKIISFGTDDINAGNSGLSDGSGYGNSSCPICHFCPQPLGLCIFIWLLILLVVIVLIIVIVSVSKKKKKGGDEKKGGR